MFRRCKYAETIGNGWYARKLLAVSFSFLCYFTHAVGFDTVGYAGAVRRYELFVCLSVGASVVAVYCWYRGTHTGT